MKNPLFTALTAILMIVLGVSACVPLNPHNYNGVDASGKSTNNSKKRIRRGTGLAASTLVGDSSTPYSSSLMPPIGGGSLWNTLRSDFQLPTYEDQGPVRAQINWFMTHQAYLNRTIGRAAPYIYYIYQQVKQRNLPAELVLLPVIESAYNPFVSSSAGASGLWQLMPGTARGFGVRQNWWFDGRRDIFASTNAALDYLTYLQSYFGGDWLLAIAAYDTGEGNVQSAIRRNAVRDKSTAFWSLPLAIETRSYVPRLLALAAIIRDPAKYGITLPAISDQPYLEQVDVGVQISLSDAARLAGMSLTELKQLNPGYSRNVTDPTGPHRLILPVNKISLFKEQLAGYSAEPQRSWERYKVQRGDTLDKIADRFGTTVAELRQANHLKSGRAPIGKIITIPGSALVPQANTANENAQNDQNFQANSTDSTTQASEQTSSQQTSSQQTTATTTETTEEKTTETSTEKNQKIAHTVKRGETLETIARANNVSVSELRHWNKLKKTALKPGQKLWIIKSETQTTTNEISRKPSINTQNTDAKIAIESKRVSKREITKPKTTTTKTVHYTVRSGDTLSSIAKRFDIKASEIKHWNGLKSEALKPGQKLIISS